MLALPAVGDIRPVDLLIPGCPPGPGQIARVFL
jgi:coenzyme F420-reducing hydrogenase gamma subunit